jgi:hypothetical protein
MSLFQCVQPIYVILKTCVSEKPVDFQQTTQRDIPEDRALSYFSASEILVINRCFRTAEIIYPSKIAVFWDLTLCNPAEVYLGVTLQMIVSFTTLYFS